MERASELALLRLARETIERAASTRGNDRTNDRLIDRPIDRPIDHAMDRPMDREASTPIDQEIDLETDHPSDGPMRGTLPEDPEFRSLRGAFVSLHTRDGAVRGCVGITAAVRPLVDVIIDMARAAAMRDPRFTPV